MKQFTWILLFIGLNVVKASIELTGVECISLDKKFFDFEYCHIIQINSRYYAEAKLKLYQVPVDNVTVKISFMKNANGYKQLFDTTTLDACKFMKNRKWGLVSYIYSFVDQYTNINHTCPYNHDLIISKMDTKIAKKKWSKIFSDFRW